MMKRAHQLGVARARAKAERLLVHGTRKQQLAYAQSAVERFPRDPDLRLTYATVLLASRPEDARMEAQRAVELDGCDDPVQLINGGTVLLGTGDLDGARRCARRADAAAPTNAVVINELLHLRGCIALLAGDDREAEKTLAAAHGADPSHEGVAINLARALGSAGRFAEASAVIQRTLAMPGAGTRASLEMRRELSDLNRRFENAESEPTRARPDAPVGSDSVTSTGLAAGGGVTSTSPRSGPDEGAGLAQ